MNTWVDLGEVIGWVWIAIGVVLVIMVCLFVGLSYLRREKPHTGKMDRTQAQVNKKVYSDGKIPPDVVQTGTNGKKSLLDRTKEKLGLSAKVLWSLAAVSAGIVLWYTIPNTEIRPKDVGNWSQAYWLQILIVYSIGAALIWLNAEEKTAKTLQKVLAGGVVILLIALPFWSWIVSPSSAPQYDSPRAKIPLTSMPKTSWARLEVPEHGRSALIPIDPDKAIVPHGEEFRVHCVYRDGHELSFGKGEKSCPEGDMPWFYIENTAKGPNVILYAYVP